MGVVMGVESDVAQSVGEHVDDQASAVWARIVDDLRRDVFTNAELAAVTGVKVRQVQHWASGAHRPQGAAKDRLLEVHYITERLLETYTPEGADIWVHARNKGLAGQKPYDLLIAGKFEEVIAAVDRLATGAM